VTPPKFPCRVERHGHQVYEEAVCLGLFRDRDGRPCLITYSRQGDLQVEHLDGLYWFKLKEPL